MVPIRKTSTIAGIWQSVIYALKEGAEAEVLPKAEEPAAQAILLPDLVTALDGYDFGAAKPESRCSGKCSAFRDARRRGMTGCPGGRRFYENMRKKGWPDEPCRPKTFRTD
jgi:hypothetical protein